MVLVGVILIIVANVFGFRLLSFWCKKAAACKAVGFFSFSLFIFSCQFLDGMNAEKKELPLRVSQGRFLPGKTCYDQQGKVRER